MESPLVPRLLQPLLEERLVKMPRLYFGDTGLAAHPAGIRSEAELVRHEAASSLLENLVWHHLRCWADVQRDPVNRSPPGQPIAWNPACLAGSLPAFSGGP